MNTVPSPEPGSVVREVAIVPKGLSPGFYNDVDISLVVFDNKVVIIAPNETLASQIECNLPIIANRWDKMKDLEEFLTTSISEFRVWRDLLNVGTAEGKLTNASQEYNRRGEAA